MSHTIAPIRRRVKRVTPMSLYETNFKRIHKLFPDLMLAHQEAYHGGDILCLGDPSIRIDVIEQHKYTSIIKLIKEVPAYLPSQTKPNSTDEIHKNSDAMVQVRRAKESISMLLRVCYDARVIEVISFQGSQPIKSYTDYPNQDMFLPDEKKQLNQHLQSILQMGLDCTTNSNSSVLTS